MISLRYGDDKNVAAWVADKLNLDGFSQYSAIGITRDGELIAGWVYSNYQGHDVEITVAATDPRWLSRARLYMLFMYPFRQLKVRRITASIAKRNKRARKVCEGLGFKHEGTLRKGYNGRQDRIVYGMLENECRFLLR